MNRPEMVHFSQGTLYQIFVDRARNWHDWGVTSFGDKRGINEC